MLQFIDQNKRTFTYYAFYNELNLIFPFLLWRVLTFEEKEKASSRGANTQIL